MRSSRLFHGQARSVVAGMAGSALTLVAVVGLFAAVGVGNAEGESTINGCVGRSGQLRVVDSPADCRRAETALAWNQEGPVGPPGPAATFVRRTEAGTIEPHDWQSVQSFCLPGEVVTGGGYSLGSIGFNDKVHVDEPLTVDELDGWIVSVHNDTDFEIDLWVTAICAGYPSLP